jgi:YYY domain-containing protein
MVSDLHAHVINMIFVLTVIALAVAVGMGVLSRRKQQWGDPAFWAVVFLIGLFPATNFWDFPIYITVACAIYFYANLRVYEFSLRSCLTTLRQLILTGCAAFAVVFPFHMSFISMSSKIALVQTRSRFYQLLVLYGYQTVFFVMLLVIVYQAYRNLNPASLRSGSGQPGSGKSGSSRKSSKKSAKNKKQAPSPSVVDTHPLYIPVSEKQQPRVLFDFLERINPADALALILFVCALGLILIPEIVYVVDIYPSHPRANTMFKLCYQAFIMLALCVGYTSFRLIHLPKPDRSKFLLPAGILIFCAFVYPYYALEDWYWPHKFQGLDGTRYMLTHQEKLGQAEDAPYELVFDDDYELIQYVKRNIKGTPVITEANGSSNTSYGRISANTGLPDIFNWYVHQQLWRNSDIPAYDERITDLETIYTQTDQAAVTDVIRKYQVKYIVVGKLERAKYEGRLNEALLTGLGEIVFQKNQTLLIEVRPS